MSNYLDNMCQCPQSCFLHFYTFYIFGYKNFKRCQCPQSCFLHFYNINFETNLELTNVSMPSVVLSSFLRTCYSGCRSIHQACQCPQSCFLHFYQLITRLAIGKTKCVNALSRAFFISTASKSAQSAVD